MNDSGVRQTEYQAAVSTVLLSALLTEHAQRVGALLPNQVYVIEDIEVRGDVSLISGWIEERIYQ